jgi:nucleotide-binding universal stress UspA family protein
MTFVAGYAPDERGPTALHLAAMLARSSGEHVVVCVVDPEPWFPSMARVDAEYRAELAEEASDAVAHARKQLPDDVSATFVRHQARSVPAGLLEVAEQHAARLIVLGSSSAGVFGQIALGSTTNRLLHSSEVPVALAPRGFREKPGARVRRVTVAYGDTERADALAVAAAPIAASLGVSMRLATFAVWSRPAYTMRLGTEQEDAVLADWVAEVRAAADEALAAVKSQPDAPSELESVIGIGNSWAEAIDDIEWAEGDVMVVGSSSSGVVARVFLGTRGTKIVRQSPVPVIVVPRG